MKPIVCLDVDGVLATYNGWQGIDNIGPPIPGAVEFTKQLSEFAYILIYTTRCKEYPVGKEAPPGATDPDRRPAPELARIVSNWLNVHGFAYDDIYIGQGKPYCSCFIDDRNVYCAPQNSHMYKAADVYATALKNARVFCDEFIKKRVSPLVTPQLKGEPSV